MNYNDSHVEHFSNLVTSEGWELMRSWLDEKITYHKDQLVNCKVEDVEKHRNMISAFKAVLNHPHDAIEENANKTVAERSN